MEAIGSVFKQELNWSSYQKAQMDVLKSIGKSLKNTLDNMNTLNSSSKKIDLSLQTIASNIIKDKDALESYRTAMRRLDETTQNFNHRLEKRGKELEENITTLSTVFKRFTSEFDLSLREIGEAANNLSTMSNQMIKLSGMEGSAVQDFRGDIMKIVDRLNWQTGGAFNPTKAYSDVISISQGITSNLGAIEEMARPLLLSSETLDVNINHVAEIFNKFYTRYTFSSTSMESVLDEIRGNTAGNSASAEATIKNIESLEGWINNYAVNDNALREELLEKVSHYTSWLESMNLNSEKFTGYLSELAYGNIEGNKELLHILSKSGIDYIQAQNMARTGQYEELTSAIMDGIYSIMKQFDKNGDNRLMANEISSLHAVLQGYNIDRDLALEIWNTKNADNYMTLEDFMESIEDNTKTMSDLVDDKYVSAADKIRNTLLEKIYQVVANLQENNPLGFGLTDALLAWSIFRGGGFGGSGKVGKLGSLGAGNILDFAGSSANIARTGTIASKVMGGAGILGGGLLAADGFSGMVDDSKNTSYRTLSGIEGATGAIGAGALLTSGVIGAATSAGLIASTGALGAIGAAAGPIGWIALAAGGAALGLKKLDENLNPASKAAGNIAAEFESMDKKLLDSNMERLSELATLRDSISGITDYNTALEVLTQSGLVDFDEAVKSAKDSGLLANDAIVDSTEELLLLIEATKNTTSSLIALNDATLDAAGKYAKEKYAEEAKEKSMDLYNAISARMGSDAQLTSSEDAADYNMIKSYFTSMANDISDDKARNKWLSNIDEVFGDKTLNSEELLALLGQRGTLNQWKKDSALYNVDNYDTFNAMFRYFGVDTIDVEDTPIRLQELYNSWMTARSEEKKKEAINEFKRLYEGLEDDTYRDMFHLQAEEMGIKAYALGTNYISHDQLALVHRGEAIVPKEFNPSVFQNSSLNTRELIEELKEIKTLLTEWKSYNEKRARIDEIRNKYGTLRQAVNTYNV